MAARRKPIVNVKYEEDEQRHSKVDVRYAPALNPRMEWKGRKGKGVRDGSRDIIKQESKTSQIFEGTKRLIWGIPTEPRRDQKKIIKKIGRIQTELSGIYVFHLTTKLGMPHPYVRPP